MIFILIIIVVVALFISDKHQRENITEQIPQKQETSIKDIKSIVVLTTDNKTIYIITSDTNDGDMDIQDIINNYVKSKKDSMLVSETPIEIKDKDRILINAQKEFDKIVNSNYGKVIIYKKNTDNILSKLKEKYPDNKIREYNGSTVPNELIKELTP